MMLRQSRVRVVAAVLVTGLLAGTAVLPAYAQNATKAPAAQAPAAQPPAAPAPSPEQLALAMQFLQLSGLTKGFDDVIPQFLQYANSVYTSQRPELASMINQVTISLVPEFMKQRVELDRSLAELYTARFSDDELRQLIAFYQSPVGQKLAKEQQEILNASPPKVQEWTRNLQESIMKRIKDEVAKRGENLGGPPAAVQQPGQ